MGFFLRNLYDIKILLPDVGAFLTALSQENIVAMHLKLVDELTVQFQVYDTHFPAVRKLVLRYGGKIQICSCKGWKGLTGCIRGRSCLLVGIAILLILTIYIPSKIYFITVEGNESVSTAKILDIAQRCGLSFGAERKEIRSEKVKNALLQNMPELKWAGINTYGCCAVISVKERQVLPAKEAKNTVQGIYAISDGVISDMTVLKGSAMCKPGQAVQKGQLLISGYTDCNTIIRAQRAEGEVFALTQRQLRGVYMQPLESRQVIAERVTGLRLVFGKKYINFDIGSGNYEAGCGKLYRNIDLMLPGGFQLPVSLVVEVSREYEMACAADTGESPEYLKELSRTYLRGVMLAGQILNKEESISKEDHLWIIDGNYTCNEMIGRLQKEEIRIFDD